MPPLEARCPEDGVQPFGLGLPLHKAGTRDHPGFHAVGHAPPARHRRGASQVFDAAVGAGADEHPVDRQRRERLARLQAHVGQPLDGLAISHAFIGSCTNGRIDDLRDAARVLRGRRVAPGVRALVVPGSTQVRDQAEAEGLAQVFRDAGFEWRQAGCSMCVAMNDDHLGPGDRCASSTNRNFEGRQGPGARTHLMSPAMVAAAAVTGALTDVRRLLPQGN